VRRLRRVDILLFFIGIGLLAYLFLSLFPVRTTSAQKTDCLPTKESPLVIDSKKRCVLLYAVVSENLKTSTHFGVVFKDGKLADKALFRAYVSPREFHDALLAIGMRPGDNLTSLSKGKYVAGDPLDVTVTWPGLNKEFPLKEILTDSGGKGFQIRFGGNRTASAAENSGCLTCLESCWVGITSNAAYPVTGTLKRFFSPNSEFSINRNVIQARGGGPVILIYRAATGN